MGLHVSAERGRCIGAGLCVLTAPDVFEHDDDEGLVSVLDATPPAEHHEDVRLAQELCPANAIALAVPR
ncbi:ferredoxin [Saccharothrix syringae]|uniref:Ferredoxin n=1 Tax=Saccharothrix syringae TaxID=103733 RepID=A0A5Q0GYX6_SACSY|nr:ferredoxin [Saccharothrix syringae]QFZ19221.1 ferredoxin [Saccharothrix syringae]